jgi:DNA helicase-2/ATP-dependent DNA helicase PcrA
MPPIHLSPEQGRAVAHLHGPALVVAGAGTGKTTVLVHRVAALLEARHGAPDEITLISYTKNAAARMREKLEQLVVPLLARPVAIHTFHDWCFQLLQQHGRGFEVVDENDLWIEMRRRLARRELPLEHFTRAAKPAEFLDDLLRFFERCHDELASAAAYGAWVEQVARGECPLPRLGKHSDDLPRDEIIARCREIAALYEYVEAMLRRDGLGTFGHMVLGAVELLRGDPEALRAARARCRYLLLDEFQDANVAQIELAALLAGEERNVFAVGDPDQAIYRFRGASSAAFEEFARRFPGTEVLHLTENRRSRAAILECAGELIAHNPAPGAVSGVALERRKLQSARDAAAAVAKKKLAPCAVDAVTTGGVESEAAYVAEQIANQITSRQPQLRCSCEGTRHPAGWCNFAVLYRSHAHRQPLAHELAARNIPFVVKGLGIRDTPAGRDLLAVLRAVADRSDAVSVFRTAALPQFTVDAPALREQLVLRRSAASVASALASVAGGDAVLAALDAAGLRITPDATPAAEALAIACEIFRLPLSTERAVLADYIAEWSEKPLTRSGTLAEFVEYLDWLEERGSGILLPDAKEEAPITDAVRLMTTHVAKGLEFTAVFVLRANKNSFPGSYREPLFDLPVELRSRMSAEDDGKALHEQEERRLFYVAMTRARDALAICGKRGRGKDARPEGYLRELLGNAALAPFLRSLEAPPATHTIQATALTPIAQWVELPPRPPLLAAALSASAIESYRRCPLQFKLKRDWNLPEAPPAALRFGNAMHQALRAWGEAVKNGEAVALSTLLTVFHAVLDVAPIAEPHQDALYRRQGEAQLRKFLKTAAATPQRAIIAVEAQFEFELAGVRLKGRIDRIDRIDTERVAVVDYKTGSPRDEDDAKNSLQLGLYAIAAQHLGHTPATLEFYNLENNAAVATTRTERQLSDVEEKVVEVAAQIAAGEFAPKPGYQCRSCAYRAVCPATEEALFTIQRAQAAN